MPGLRDANTFFCQITQIAQRLALGQHQVQVFGVEICHDAQFRMRLALELALTQIHGAGHVGCCHTGLQLAVLNCGVVEHRSSGGLGNRDQAGNATLTTLIARARAGWRGNAVCDGPTDGEIGTTGTACTNAEECRALGGCGSGQKGNRSNGAAQSGNETH